MSNGGIAVITQPTKKENVMRKSNIVFVLMLMLLVSSITVAQPGRGNRTEMTLKKIKEKVGLTEQQTAKVKEILEKSQEKMRKEFETNDGDRSAMREAMQKLMKESDAEIEKLLTKEQGKKFDEYKKERNEEIRNRMKERQR
jgi:Spy/CpxP family protein refolding chaperone